MTIPKAGHYVPTDVLEVTQSILNDYFTKGSLQCHNTDGCSTKGKTCEFMNNCMGNGVCDPNNGECLCNKGWVGGDCGKRLQYLTPFFSQNKIISGAEWTFFTYDEALYYNERYELTLQSESPMDIYLTHGSIAESEPHEFNYDVAFKQQKYLKLTSDMFSSQPLFSVAVLVNNLVYYTNTTG